MNHWIAEARAPLEVLLGRVDVLVINDEEARELAREDNIARAARRILGLGVKRVLIKRGEYGAILFSADSVFAVPAFPLEEVFDPTGAGDTFAGGLMGYLAACGDLDEKSLRRAMALSGGGWEILFESPLAIGIWIAAALALGVPLLRRRV